MTTATLGDEITLATTQADGDEVFRKRVLALDEKAREERLAAADPGAPGVR